MKKTHGLLLSTVMLFVAVLLLGDAATAQNKPLLCKDLNKLDVQKDMFLDLREASLDPFETRYLTCGKWEVKAIEGPDPSRPVAWSSYDREECRTDSCDCPTGMGYTASFNMFYTYYPKTGPRAEDSYKLFPSTPRACKYPGDIIKKARPHTFDLEKNAMVTFWLTTAYTRIPYDIRGGGLTIRIKKLPTYVQKKVVPKKKNKRN